MLASAMEVVPMKCKKFFIIPSPHSFSQITWIELMNWWSFPALKIHRHVLIITMLICLVVYDNKNVKKGIDKWSCSRSHHTFYKYADLLHEKRRIHSLWLDGRKKRCVKHVICSKLCSDNKPKIDNRKNTLTIQLKL